MASKNPLATLVLRRYRAAVNELRSAVNEIQVLRKLVRSQSDEIASLKAAMNGDTRITELVDFQTGDLIVTGEKWVKVKAYRRITELALTTYGNPRRKAIEDILHELDVMIDGKQKGRP